MWRPIKLNLVKRNNIMRIENFNHVSVLLKECINGLNIKPDGIYVDGTLGGAGHSSEIIKKNIKKWASFRY